MSPDTWNRLTLHLSSSPILRAETLPTVEEVDRACEAVGVPFPQEYRDFLLRFGGAMVGPYPIYGLRPVEVMGVNTWSVVEMTKHYRADGWPGAEEWVIISTDHGGNPIGMDAKGLIWTFDHDFGGLYFEADNFEEYVRVKCLGLLKEG